MLFFFFVFIFLDSGRSVDEAGTVCAVLKSLATWTGGVVSNQEWKVGLPSVALPLVELLLPKQAVPKVLLQLDREATSSFLS